MEIITKNQKVIIFLFGAVFFSFLFYISWIFFKERVLAFDPAFFSFLMIDQKDFSIALGRWGSVFSQALPLMAFKNGCALSTFLHLFSVAPIINYILIFLIITFGLKNYKASLALMLSLCLAFRHAFYYTTAELYLGIALSVLLWAIISIDTKSGSKFRQYSRLFFVLALIYIMSYLHQLTLFTILFVIITELVGKKRFKERDLWIVLGATIIWYLIRIYVLTDTNYEKEKIPSISVFIEQLPNLRYLPSTIYFKHFAPYQLWPMFLLFAASWYYLFRKKNWLYFLFLPAYSIAFLILILITYYKGESPLMYENYYTVLGFFAAVAFIFSAEGFFNKGSELLVIFLLLVVNCKGIYNAHEILTKRVEYLGRLVDYGRKQENRKFLISDRNFPWQYGWVDWAVPFETTLYSGIADPDSVVTFFVTEDMNKYDSLIHKENVFLGPRWEVSWFGSQNIYRNYFHFPSSGYDKLNTPQDDTAFHEEQFNSENVMIQPEQDIFYSGADSFVVVPIRIINTSGKKLASLPAGATPTFLSYHVYDQKGNQIIADGTRTPLEVDIKGTYRQGLNIKFPKEHGDYTIEVDLVTENKRWWGINSKFVLVVK
jgi:hypothetical protein